MSQVQQSDFNRLYLQHALYTPNPTGLAHMMALVLSNSIRRSLSFILLLLLLREKKKIYR